LTRTTLDSGLTVARVFYVLFPTFFRFTMRTSIPYDERKKKSFTFITRNGKLLFYNPIVSEDCGVVYVDRFSFKLAHVTGFSVDRKTETITISLIGEKNEEMKKDVEGLKSYMASLSW